jgi:hypothetical protein
MSLLTNPDVARVNKAIERAMVGDLNKDGILTREEAIIFSDQKTEQDYSRRGHVNSLERFLELDPNDDGKLHIHELRILASKAFRFMDKNQDQILSDQEHKYVTRIRNVNRKAVAAKERCDIPKAGPHEKLVYINVHGGETVSNISVAGQEHKTHATPVKIGVGEEKLYIVASSITPMIWKFYGQTERISKLVLMGPSIKIGDNKEELSKNYTNAGATGVSGDNVTFRNARLCGMASLLRNPKMVSSELQKYTGQTLDLFYGSQSAIGLHIFDGRINTDTSEDIKSAAQKAPSGFDDAFWKKFVNLSSGGVLHFDQKDIVSNAPIEPYLVLPEFAGFAKLAYEGYVTQDTQSGRGVKIIKNILYFPSGLKGGHSAKITLAKGVDIPKGGAGHSKVFLEDTGEQLPWPHWGK